MNRSFIHFFSRSSFFWTSYPLFFCATFLLFGIAWTMTHEQIFLICGLFLSFLLLVEKKRLFFLFSLLFFSLGAFHGSFRLSSLPLEKTLQGKGEFIIENFYPIGPKKTLWIYQGNLKTFSSNSTIYKNIPCQFTYMGSSKRPSGYFTYLLEGTLTKKRENSYSFKLQKKKPPIVLSRHFSLSEVRFQAKEAVFSYLQKKIPNPKSSAFLSALLIGKTNDSSLRSLFGKLGLQHIMAISGFHFSLFTFFFSFLLFAFPSRWKNFFLLLIVNGYFLFLGMNPSITRAYISIQLSLFALLLARRYSPLNALAAGLLFEMLLDPLSLWNLGLELSYLACGAIFILYPVIEKNIKYFFQARSESSYHSLSLLGQSVVSFAAFFRASFSLCLAINLILIPVLLYQFHIFPLMSMVYNLFIPLFVSVCLFFTLSVMGICLLLPFLANPLFSLVSSITYLCLEYVFTAPTCLQLFIRMPHLPFSLVIAIITLLFFTFGQMQNRASREDTLPITL